MFWFVVINLVLLACITGVVAFIIKLINGDGGDSVF